MKKTLHTTLCIKGELVRCHIQYDGHLMSRYTVEKPLVYSVWSGKLLYRFVMPVYSTQSKIILHIEKEYQKLVQTDLFARCMDAEERKPYKNKRTWRN